MSATGRILRYDILATLGEGGSARVYAARDLHTGREVALKLLLPGTISGARVEGLLREARVVAALKDPHIVAVHECGIFDGAPYLAMERLDGETLAARLARAPKTATVSEVVAWARGILAGLAVAHAAGVVHGDVHPGNVFLTRSGGLKLLDFGLAPPPEEEAQRSEAGVVFGAAGYVAPERYLGKGPSARADLYAVGAILFRALAGRLPFEDTATATAAERVTRERAPALAGLAPHVPGWMADAIDRALARDPDARFAGATAFTAALAGECTAVALPTRSFAAVAPPAPSAAPRRAWSARRVVLALGAVIVGLLAVVAFRARTEVRTGRFTETQTCSGIQRLRFEAARIEVAGGRGIVASGFCTIDLVDSTVIADQAGLTVEAGVAVHATRTTIASPGVAIQSDRGDITLTDCDVRGDVGIQGSGDVRLTRGRLEGKRFAFLLTSASTMKYVDVEVVGRGRKSDAPPE